MDTTIDKNWFRTFGGRVDHLCVGYKDGPLGLLAYKTACGKVYYPDPTIPNSFKRCQKCCDAEHQLEQPYGDGVECENCLDDPEVDKCVTCGRKRNPVTP